MLQVHQGYSELVKGLLEKLTQDHSTSAGITAAAFMVHLPEAEAAGTVSSRSHVKSHADLRYAVALLLLAAEALPEQDVEFTVCRLLFDQASPATLPPSPLPPPCLLPPPPSLPFGPSHLA